MAALGNALGDDVLRDAFADRGLERALRPVIGAEHFSHVAVVESPFRGRTALPAGVDTDIQ